MRISSDVGGTFTDFVELQNNELRAFKILSSPNPEEIIEKGIKGKTVDLFSHGTTLGTNAVLEKKGARTALITTRGFKDVIYIGRQSRPKLYELDVSKPEPLPAAVYELDERIAPDGKVLKKLKENEIERLKRKLKKNRIESVAVCFLFSFVNDEHEKVLKDKLELPCSISGEVIRECREYERSSTTVLDAYVKPKLKNYLKRMRRIKGMPPDIWVMQSNGGVEKAEEVLPVNTLLSGPAGGVAASKWLSDKLGLRNVITFDMGGTSTDVSVLVDGKILKTLEEEIGGYSLTVPTVDIVTVGAGGGSIAWLDQGGAVRVGPQSAGADPGPICYGKGGEKPTVTDTNFLLGYLGDTISRVKLKKGPTENLINQYARRWKLDRLELLGGIRKLVNFNMGQAIRKVTLERGYDPREFSLIAFGGAGPMHACDLAKQLDIKEVIIPPIPGAFSALGILVCPFTLEYSKSVIATLTSSIATAKELIDRFIKNAEEKIRRYELSNPILFPSLDLRYKGQSYYINVPFHEGNLEGIENSFRENHRIKYGYSANAPIELVNVRLRVECKRIDVNLPRPERGSSIKGRQRSCIFNGEEIETVILKGIGVEFESEGPLIVEQETATVVVPPSFNLTADEYGVLYLRRRK
jgi:N-methylhydantoinase A